MGNQCEHLQTVVRDGHIYCADCGVDVIGTGIPGGKERHGRAVETCPKCGRIIGNEYQEESDDICKWENGPVCRDYAEVFELKRQLAAVTAERDRLRGLLERCQWCIPVDSLRPDNLIETIKICPCCGRWERGGHSTECEIRAALKPEIDK